MFSRLLISCLLLVSVINAYAGQDTDGGSNTPVGNFSVEMDLNFEINIPAVLYFRVGSAGATIDEVEFDLESSYGGAGTGTYNGGFGEPGSGDPIAATNNGTLLVELRSNVGDIEISATVSNPLGLGNGAGQFIDFDEIDTASDDAGVPAPVLTNAGGAPVSVTANLFSGLVTDRTANWTYSYANTQAKTAGVYTGTVTYTASTP